MVEQYFNKHPYENKIAAKDLMPHFIKAGIFEKDQKNGKPLRDILRALDKNNQLKAIPFAYAERKTKNVNWFFIMTKDRQNKTNVDAKVPNSYKHHVKMQNGKDEHYILDLCDELLNLKGERQKRFEFLVGDLHRNCRTRTKLPCDIFYQEHQLVIEYNEKQHTSAVPHFDKPNLMTVSGVNRREQRKQYDLIRRKTLPQHGITVLDLNYSDFAHKSNGKLVRNEIEDRKVISEKLQNYMPKSFQEK